MVFLYRPLPPFYMQYLWEPIRRCESNSSIVDETDRVISKVYAFYGLKNISKRPVATSHSMVEQHIPKLVFFCEIIIWSLISSAIARLGCQHLPTKVIWVRSWANLITRGQRLLTLKHCSKLIPSSKYIVFGIKWKEIWFQAWIFIYPISAYIRSYAW